MDIHREKYLLTIYNNQMLIHECEKYSVKRNSDSANSLVVEPIDVKPLI